MYKDLDTGITAMKYRGGLVRAYFGEVKFGKGKFWYKILKTMEKCGTSFPNNGQSGIEPGTLSVEM